MSRGCALVLAPVLALVACSGEPDKTPTGSPSNLEPTDQDEDGFFHFAARSDDQHDPARRSTDEA